MVGIILYKLVDFGVQLGLLVPVSGEGAAIGKFHQTLEGDTNALSSVMTGNAGLMRDSRIDHIVHYNFGVACGLDGMDHSMAGFVPLHRLVPAFVKSRIVVRDMTGGAAHAAIVATLVSAFNANVTALAIGAKVGIDGLVGLFLEGFNVGFRDSYEFGRKVVWKGLHERFGVFLVLFCSEYRVGAIRVIHIVVAVFRCVTGSGRTPAPDRTLDLSGFCIHDGTVLGIHIFFVALAASFLIDPDGTGMKHKCIQGASLRCAGMSLFRILFFNWIASMADHTTIGIAELLAQVIDPFGHVGIVCPDGLDTRMALARRQTAGIRCGITRCVHFRQWDLGAI